MSGACPRSGPRRSPALSSKFAGQDAQPSLDRLGAVGDRCKDHWAARAEPRVPSRDGRPRWALPPLGCRLVGHSESAIDRLKYDVIFAGGRVWLEHEQHRVFPVVAPLPQKTLEIDRYAHRTPSLPGTNTRSEITPGSRQPACLHPAGLVGTEPDVPLAALRWRRDAVVTFWAPRRGPGSGTAPRSSPSEVRMDSSSGSAWTSAVCRHAAMTCATGAGLSRASAPSSVSTNSTKPRSPERLGLPS